MEILTITSDFIFLGSKITADGDCSHEVKRRLLLGRRVMTNLDSILKSRDITLSTKVRLVKAMVFPVVMYGCESWTIKKAESRRINAFELWCWRRLLRVPWTARRSNQSILKETSPGHCKDWCWGWNPKELDTTERLNWTEVFWRTLPLRLLKGLSFNETVWDTWPSYPCVCALVTQSCPALCDPMDYIACQTPLSMALNTGVGCHFFFQGILPTQGSNLGLLHFRQIPYHLSQWGSLFISFIVFLSERVSEMPP